MGLFLNGYKAIIGFLLANLFAAHPMIVDSINKAVADPSLGTVAAAAGQVLLVIGIGHQVVKKM